ncbi:nucleolar complex-associated protein-domain-containing protein [Cyathus striatus]|nr:nucleolar complex-associated protein-domain-containing protein [Cyathus striatus]
MAIKQKSKRKNLSSSNEKIPSKKRKVGTGASSSVTKSAKSKGKERASDRKIIPIPSAQEDSDIDLSEQDLEVLDHFGQAASFLRSLDQSAISRSKKETVRLHELSKPARKDGNDVDDLPPLSSDDSDISESESVDYQEESDSTDGSDSVSTKQGPQALEQDSDTEMPYESIPRRSWKSSEPASIQRLPIKLKDGRVQNIGTKPFVIQRDASDNDEDDDFTPSVPLQNSPVAPGSGFTGTRFGRLGIADILQIKSRKERVECAKVQIAEICQEILSEPEYSLGLLKRLHSFSLKELSVALGTPPLPNDSLIRRLAILSQLAIFRDVAPGYRIRPLTDKEKAEKVGQVVARTREWEQGLVSAYQTFLQVLESELKEHTDLAEVALRTMCTLLTDLVHFNFRVNIMTCVITRLSKKSWDNLSGLCLDTLIKVFKTDATGEASLEIVRLLNRMVKERRFKIHPRVLSCLLHLRLRTELGVRASERSADKESDGVLNNAKRKSKKADQVYLSKKARKALKEKKEIEKEMQEAEAEVDKEQKAAMQTETLKLLFALYFRILKNPAPTSLLPAALLGISKFAHLVNIDFFKDLMLTLKNLICIDENAMKDDADDENDMLFENDLGKVSRNLLCVVTAFELLTGQGEALNIDLSDFVARLYTLLLPLSMMSDIDSPLPFSVSNYDHAGKTESIADMLFRALDLVFSPRTSGSAAPPWRSAAFSKRLLLASLHWPPPIAIRAIKFVLDLVAKDRKLEALLCTEDRIFDGVYRPEVDDPQLCHPFGTSFYEVLALQMLHFDPTVRKVAEKLQNFVGS